MSKLCDADGSVGRVVRVSVLGRSPVPAEIILKKSRTSLIFLICQTTGRKVNGITAENKDVDTNSAKNKILFSKFHGPNSVNSFSGLSDGQIALILVAIVVLVIIITAFIVRQCVIEKRKKAFGEFVDNLPNAIEVDVSISNFCNEEDMDE